jgi:hypothetical protein
MNLEVVPSLTRSFVIILLKMKIQAEVPSLRKTSQEAVHSQIMRSLEVDPIKAFSPFTMRNNHYLF